LSPKSEAKKVNGSAKMMARKRPAGNMGRNHILNKGDNVSAFYSHGPQDATNTVIGFLKVPSCCREEGDREGGIREGRGVVPAKGVGGWGASSSWAWRRKNTLRLGEGSGGSESGGRGARIAGKRSGGYPLNTTISFYWLGVGWPRAT